MKLQGSWLWTKEPLSEFNRFVEFRKTFDYNNGKCDIKITGDTRFVLYVNGEYVGYGPVRAWPNHYKYDIYDLKPYMKKGKNVICVELVHYNTSTFQSIQCDPGLYCEIELEGKTIFSDKTFKVRKSKSFENNVHRLSVQQGFEEVYYAENDDGWRDVDYNDSSWENAFEIRPGRDGLHNDLSPKDTKNLTMEPLSPQRIVSNQVVKSADYFMHFNLKEALFPNNRNSNRNYINSFVGTYILSDRDCECSVRFETIQNVKLYVNGKETEKKSVEYIQGPVSECTFKLKKGLNDFLFQPCFFHHLHDYSFAFFTEGKLEWTINSDTSKFALIGPFELPEFVKEFAYNDYDDEQNYTCPTDEKRSYSLYEEYLKNPLIETYKGTELYKEINMELCPLVSPYFQSYTDVVVGDNNEDYSYLIGNNTWTKIEPNKNGDIRILLDYGTENTGYQTFEVNGPCGVILDFHNFEFIQPDGIYNYAEGMRNSIRYVTREGRQSYKSLYRRGFQYSYLTIRNLKEPLYIRNINLLISSIQYKNDGYFYCSDYKLNKIFEVCIRSARNCSEDTFTDCPTYEQTAWLGDCVIISKTDFLINGNTKALYRGLILGGQSLERSEIIESQVPSGWQDILPLVVAYWMETCGEYYNQTGDIEGSKEFIEYLKKNFEGIKKNINEYGLFEKRCWNVCDWANMDTPCRAIVTFVQFRLAKALMDTYDFAKKIGYDFPEWKELGESMRQNTYKYMWNEEKQAYTDCLRRIDGKLVMSDVYSQQTQTYAYLGEFSQERKDHLINFVLNPPADFVKAGSSCFEDILLRLYTSQNKTMEVLNLIRDDWSFMLDKGATTFWEMWTYGEMVKGRLTRSHCHGYSSSPAYHLINYVLGIKAKEPGFSKIVIEPHLGDLSWARGAINTQYGRVEVQVEKDEKGELKVDVKSPVPYEIII